MFHSYSIRYFYLINLVVESVNERRCLICFFVFFFILFVLRAVRTNQMAANIRKKRQQKFRCSLHIQAQRETTKIENKKSSKLKRSQCSCSARKAPHFLLNFAKSPCLIEKCLSTSKQVKKFLTKSSREGQWCIDFAQKM